MSNLETVVHSTIKEANEKRILHTAMQIRRFTKNDLVRHSGVSMTTVSKVTDEFVQKGIVKIIGQGELKTAGRKPSVYDFIPNSLHSIGISICQGMLEIAVIDLDLKVVYNKEYPIDCILTNYCDQELVRKISKTIKEANIITTNIIGIGVGISWALVDKFIDLEQTIIINNKVNIEGVSIPIMFENCTNVAALAEIQSTDNEGKNALYISISDEIDVGIVLHGNVFHSRSSTNKSLGHMVVEVGGKECECGEKGCWNKAISNKALLEEYNKVAKKVVENAKEVYDLYLKKDDVAVKICERYIKYFCVGIYNLCLAYAPEIILVEGIISKYADKLFREITNYLGENAKKIKFVDIEDKATIIGAATLPLHKVLYLEDKII